MPFVDSQGTTVTVDDGTGLSALNIGQIQSIGTFAPGTRTERDRTTLADDAIVMGYGLRDFGTFSMVCFRDPTDAGQSELRALQGATQAEEREFVVTIGTTTFTFNGVVTENPKEISTNTDVTESFTIRVNGAPVEGTAP